MVYDINLLYNIILTLFLGILDHNLIFSLPNLRYDAICSRHFIGEIELASPFMSFPFSDNNKI